MEIKETNLINVFLFVSLLLLVGCYPNIEETFPDVEASFKQKTMSDRQDINNDFGDISLYIPTNYEVVKEQTFNYVFLDQHEDLVILFYIPKEDEPRLLEQEAMAESLLFLTEEQGEEHFFLSVKSDDKLREIELTVGSGHVKLTKLTNYDKIVDDTVVLMEILHSYRWNDK
ncbi:hypothetical protein [Alkalihalobacillus pseudalcaliphilus]|uniref:hypothetical protein n=1 Tax=Alkalihalobacillus pseudalcaliphilus TaxID=79884 RepID=UPI00064DCAA4|nr:hypothetical protein [Alkalihalobacillus pseudalcaliphilus]KMK77803.1 hypothetical protein AB990_04985 [Alkalihalobacillus pseudalcaliphilus]